MSASKQADMARDLSEGIQQGRYAVGSLLPTEFELCEQYGVSRYAVRQTLKVLQDLGLISRRIACLIWVLSLILSAFAN